jgi:hypothetical protein
MDVPDTGMDPLDGEVQIWGCNGYPNQQWDLSELHDDGLWNIKDAQHGYCLTLPDGDTTNGNRVQLQDGCIPHPMSDHTTQEWLLSDHTTSPTSQAVVRGVSFDIRYKADPSKCLDAGNSTSGGMQEGFALMIWDCNDLPQQVWDYDADTQTIYLADSRRLQVSAGAARTHTAEAEEGSRGAAVNSSSKALRGSLQSQSSQCKQLSGNYCAEGGQQCDCDYCDDFSNNDECANACRVMNGYFSSPFKEHPWAAVYLENPVNAADGTDCSWMKGNGYGGKGDDCKSCDEYAMTCRRANPPRIGATYSENSGGSCRA